MSQFFLPTTRAGESGRAAVRACIDGDEVLALFTTTHCNDAEIITADAAGRGAHDHRKNGIEAIERTGDRRRRVEPLAGS
ncbi:hypothetical protein [Egicoccus sp. AB-alg2]|uniref:hypothetical protein n=1 Tax=Egicoccus sp. AB-alg2 TaxID=3242693 RepID=UPI00359DE3BA